MQKRGVETIGVAGRTGLEDLQHFVLHVPIMLIRLAQHVNVIFVMMFAHRNILVSHF
jgi:hypothetical protein